ncbi:MAG: aminoacyl-tRNA hydrolase [Tenericutes bacterium GWC2_34_14]|nr:MAG: aminoacyl-tRNA hydrolase [Tenericutes bacterium GWC2_34_14]OHE33006.1 MAG: aminoacyl-tRNA hydrolase [Tenericutes bacterium GWE2_34_108]OHE36028.1 MAG: aminoacyl-tRNA hydrolase [Tenericutes bacterium GWF1_35_14]OHE39251.1 MAG: aminoacyl-tRNA hydrolase [Tenericutes bacterium GWF2_35_184]OHE44526.1 MAG: aminoacyl-tRNA hydrolase [Tenericutes bacterium RIFOXYA2_FULL_36_32]OHE46926.1 MAG: aminoacyl-tRNA hydrolase [Tenericutes bacterium RIFOXYA12_FULL_35_10]OHE47928.1 MAG: aminoacyl-tRNA hyd
MKLVVGLGNPGLKYQKTRHNIGFMVIDDILKDAAAQPRFDAKFNAEVAILNVEGKKVCLVKPSTFMNLSGEAISKVMQYYDIPVEDLLVIVDDVNLETGKLRLRETGGHGGHNGLRNIIGLIHTEAFKRIRIGVDNNPNIPLDQYVLGQFTQDQLITLTKSIQQSKEVVEMFIEGVPYKDIMTKYNTQ